MKTLEERFDEEFMVQPDNEWHYLVLKDRVQYPEPKELKQFICKEIEDALDKVVPEERNTKYYQKLMNTDKINTPLWCARGWQNCRQEVIDNINQIKKDL